MIVPLQYAVPANGLTVGAPSSYYWWGVGGAAGTKFRANGTAVVEAGWLSGLSPVLFGSNLPIRDVVRYMRPYLTTRFSANPGTQTFGVIVGLWGMNKAVFPNITTTWQVFGPPANAT
jgi:hypothetical protein